ncbi:MAG TPA: PEFG-CTERM sorting domain-containing protein [Candidatus Nitrosotenuis sp.]|nr:PEFG-CTERM sorting domain-containing protein [Candidatus Nitrosotenuis sp.]
MRTLYTAIALFTILATGVTTVPVYAQLVDAITVSTDKDAYEDGETILVTGTVRERLSGYPVTLQVIAANGNLVTVQQLDVSSENTYGVEITAGGALWRSAGTYTIKVLYGTESRTAETTFEFSGSAGGTAPSGKSIAVTGTDFLVNYSIKGGRVISITPSIPDKSLIIQIETTSDGELTVTLPRGLIDARLGPDGQSGEDDSFFVLVDGAEVDFDETTTSSDRTLTIPFEDGATEIEIIGTFVIPEFGTMAAIILAVAIVSIIAVSAKSRLVLPKY